MISLSGLIRFLHLATLTLLVGSFAFHLVVARPSVRKAGPERWPDFVGFDRRQLRLAAWILLGVFLSGLLAFWLQIASVTGASRAQALRLDIMGEVLIGTRYGIVWLIRVVLMLLLAGVLLLLRDYDSGLLRVGALSLAAAVVMALAFSGHAAAGEGNRLLVQLVADALHLLAASIWLGALVPFAFFLVWINRIHQPWAGAAVKEATRRFSLLGLVSVSTLVLTGLFNAWSLVGAIPPLVGTTYGRLLLLKLALLLPLIGVAAVNLLDLKPRILSMGVQNSVEGLKNLLIRLKRNVVAEASLGACILLIVGAMSITPPARHIQPSWPFSFRWNWNAVKGSSKLRSQVMVGRWLAAAGMAGLCYAVFQRRHRHLALGTGLASLAYGGLVALPALSIDAYPTTYTRPSVAYNAISVANGIRLYHEACAVCHGVAGYGDGPGGKGLKPKPADLTAKHTADHTVGDLFWWLTHGVKESAMPGFNDSLDEEERWDMINFMRTLSAAEQARQMTALAEPNPWLVAPDFVYRTTAVEGKALKDHRGQSIILLVLFTLPHSQSRLEQLDQAYKKLRSLGVEVLAIPRKAQGIQRQLGQSVRLLPVVTDGSREIFDTYALYRRSLTAEGTLPDPPIPPHMEFMIDRQGYVRARWVPGDGVGWGEMKNLLREIDRLNKEKPSAPAPDEHVH